MTAAAEGREGLAALPPTSPGDVPADDLDLWGAERDPADNWGLGHDELPSVEGSPHWREIAT